MVDLGLVKATKAHCLKENKVSILFEIALQPDPDFRHSPTYFSLGRPNNEHKMLSAYSFSSNVGRSIMAPPNILEVRVAILRRAFSVIVKDDDFREDALRSNMDLNVLLGEELQKIIEEAANIPPEIVLRAKTARDERH